MTPDAFEHHTLDRESATAVVHRVPYAIETAAAKIRDAGLPVALAERLSFGR